MTIGDRPAHPRRQAISLLVGTVLVVVILAVISTLAGR